MKRLTNEEIDEIADKYLELRSAAETSEDAKKEFLAFQNEAMEKFKFLVYKRIRKYQQFPNFPDLEQEGFVALLLALDSFDSNQGCFSWWADQYIKTKISRAANSHTTMKIPIKLSSKIKPFKINSIPHMVDDTNPYLEAEKHDNIENLLDAINSLPESHQTVFNKTYGFNGELAMTANEVMTDLDLSRREYSKILREAKKSVKQQILSLDAGDE